MTSATRFLAAGLLLGLGGCIMQQPSGHSTTPPPQAQAQPAQAQPAPQPTAQMTAQPGPQAQPTAQPIMQPQPTASGTAQGMPSQSNFGTLSLAPGFMPDPHVVSGRSGGSGRADSRDSRCRGWITSQPDHLFQAQGYFDDLRVVAQSSSDITLVVLRPDGSYLCNDDFEGRNPMVRGPFQPGTYAVWVGSYQEGVMADYRLGFSELSSTTPASLGANTGSSNAGGSNDTGGSNFGTVALSSGFVPDPHVVSGVSGGSQNARQVNSSCRGWIASRPDHIFQAQSNFSSLRIAARSSSDITLVVQDSRGNVWCNDDSEGRNPMVQGQFAPGPYRVWIGSYQQGENSRYSLGFSELSSVRPSSLPAP